MKLRRALQWLVPAVAALAVAWLAVRSWTPEPAPSPAPPVEIAGPPAWMAERAVMLREAKERDGLIGRLRDQLEGRAAVQPERIVVYDTLVELVHDTVLLSVKQDGRGRIDMRGAIPADSGLHRPVQPLHYDVSRCDDGFALVGLRMMCDPARAGHVTILGRVGLAAPLPLRADGPALPVAEIAARWTPAYRSRAALEIAADRSGRVQLTAEWGWRLF